MNYLHINVNHDLVLIAIYLKGIYLLMVLITDDIKSSSHSLQAPFSVKH